MGEIGNIRSESRSIPSGMDRYIANYKADGAIGGVWHLQLWVTTKTARQI